MRSAVQQSSRSLRTCWLTRLVSVVGVVGTTWIIVWATDFSPISWWQEWHAHRLRSVVLGPSAPLSHPLVLVPPIPRGRDTSISEIPLPLLLVSVSPGATIHEGTAQIGVYLDSPQTMQAGALLENGARLAELYRDHVVLEKFGRTTTLYLDNARQVEPSSSPLLTVGGLTPVTEVKITSRELLTDYIRPSPVYERDTLIGLRVYPGSRPGPFQQSGLKPGDVITEIDDTPLSDMASAWSQLRALCTGDTMTARVRRDGAEVSVPLEGRFILSAEESPPQAPPLAMHLASGQ